MNGKAEVEVEASGTLRDAETSAASPRSFGAYRAWLYQIYGRTSEEARKEQALAEQQHGHSGHAFDELRNSAIVLPSFHG